ncbi:hypothetical protein C8034_v005265 [Colletotrichum sidae]|uniref:Uncharacterized protein n=1 Tax=Colletotrichum sidae TaxID=1347389 RepID=A0A4R8T6N1_9PEZI|nr:hypothetical protein C8034_v005265 [Colletotrichum sidae]
MIRDMASICTEMMMAQGSTMNRRHECPWKRAKNDGENCCSGRQRRQRQETAMATMITWRQMSGLRKNISGRRQASNDDDTERGQRRKDKCNNEYSRKQLRTITTTLTAIRNDDSQKTTEVDGQISDECDVTPH